MFKNRAVQVKMVRTDGDEIEDLPVETNSDTIATASVAVKDIMREGIKIVAIYIALDTTRRVILALISK